MSPLLRLIWELENAEKKDEWKGGSHSKGFWSRWFSFIIILEYSKFHPVMVISQVTFTLRSRCNHCDLQFTESFHVVGMKIKQYWNGQEIQKLEECSLTWQPSYKAWMGVSVLLCINSTSLKARKCRAFMWLLVSASYQAAIFWQRRVKFCRATALSRRRNVSWVTSTGLPSAST